MAEMTTQDIRQCLPRSYGYVLQSYIDLKRKLTGNAFDDREFLEHAIVDFLSAKALQVSRCLSLGAPMIAYTGSVDATAAADVAKRMHDILQLLSSAR